MVKQKSNQRKFFFFFVITLSILLIVGVLINYRFQKAKRPFENLRVEDVKSISLYSENVTQEIVYTFNDKECAEIVSSLNKIVIGEKDNREYIGGFDPEFRLEKNDGKVINFSVSANLWLDGQRYEVVEGEEMLFKLNDIRHEYYSEYYVPYNDKSAQGKCTGDKCTGDGSLC